MSELVSPIVIQIGAGGILGFIVGYAVKNLLKLLAVIGGVFALALIYLGYIGVITINYDQLTETVGGSLGVTTQWISAIIASLPFAGTFLVGVIIGLKRG